MSEKVLASGTIEYFDDRFYKLHLEENGSEKAVYFPSVTTILGIVNEPFLARWRGDIGNELADYRSNKAKQMGSKIHDAILRLFQGETLEIEAFQQEEWVQLLRFMEWYSIFKPQETKTEYSVFSMTDEYAGTLDLQCHHKGGKYSDGTIKTVQIPEGIYIWDYKTGKGISNKYLYQLGAYAKAVMEMTRIKLAGAGILHLQASTKTGWKAIILDSDALNDHYLTFKHAAYVWKKENTNLTPAIFDMPKEIKLEV